MKIKNHSVSAFSLVEVTLALGVAAFCLISIFGLLPVGLNSNQASIEQTAAASMATRIAADLRATPSTSGTNTINSPLYQIPIPPPNDNGNTSTYTLFLAEDGTLANVAGGDADPTKTPRYRATLFVAPPANGQKTKTMASIFLTWPALADKTASTQPSHFAGSFETVIALDRN